MLPTGGLAHNPGMCPDWETGDLSVHRPAPNPLSHTSQGKPLFYLFIFLRLYLFIFREGVRQGERQGEKHQCVVASRVPPTADLARNPGMCPDWDSNWRPFVL